MFEKKLDQPLYEKLKYRDIKAPHPFDSKSPEVLPASPVLVLLLEISIS
jgi:hypothetical protein